MNILITGASGFLGKYLCLNLQKKNNILALSRYRRNCKKNLSFIKTSFNISNKNLSKIKKFRPELVIHLAWQDIPNFSKKTSMYNFYQQKIFFKKIIKLKSVKKIIVSGSSFEYRNKNGTCKENEVFYKKIRKNYFVEAKHRLHKFLSKTKISLVWLRIFYVYGVGQRNQSLIPYLIFNLKKNSKIFLKNPFEKKDFIHVKDVINAILKILNSSHSGIINIGNGKSYSSMFIAKFLKKKLNSKSKIEFNDEKKSYLVANISKIKKLGWKPRYSIKKGLNEILNNN
jgi:nucleoside-diphosphate-sugar epimerase